MTSSCKKFISVALCLFFFFILFPAIHPNQIYSQNQNGQQVTPQKTGETELEVQYPTIPGAPTITKKTALPQYILYIYYFAIAISGVVAFGIALYGGVLFLSSGGNPAIRAAGRGYIFGGILGIAILLLVYIILSTINPQLTIFSIELPKSGSVFVPKIKESIVEKRVEEFQQIPIGTMAEKVLDKQRLEKLLTFMEGLEERSKKTRDASEELRDALSQCQCGRLSAPACFSGGSSFCSGGGHCSGEPCPNRAEIQEKNRTMIAKSQELIEYAARHMPFLKQYAKDTADLIYAAMVLKKSVLPISYDNFLELRDVLGGFGELKSDPFPGLSGLVSAAGYDSMNFYLDKLNNKQLIESIDPGEGFSFVIDPCELDPGCGEENGDEEEDGEPPPPPPPPPPAPKGHLACPLTGGSPDHGATPCFNADRGDHCHAGVDLYNTGENNSYTDFTPAYAAADGIVTYADGWWASDTYGYSVAIWHKDFLGRGKGITTWYSHLTSDIRVTKGQQVKQGDLIGFKDSTGNAASGSSDPHIHFEVFTSQDPLRNPVDKGLINPYMKLSDGKPLLECPTQKCTGSETCMLTKD